MKTINVRQAKESDIKFLAASILKNTRAGKKIGIFDILFRKLKDKDILKKLEILITIRKNFYCYYSNFLIAVCDGKNIGTVCNYEPRKFNNDLIQEIMKELNVEKQFSRYISIISFCDFTIDKKVWMLDYLTQNDNNLEIAKLLLKKSLLTASLKGYRIIHTIASSNNIDAILMYQKLGFKTILDKKCKAFEGDIELQKAIMMELRI